jgi:oxygen-independent coproporphyrinogen-3 oxidase
VRIEGYLYPRGDELTSAVWDTMALFDVPLLRDIDYSGKIEEFLPASAVLVNHRTRTDPVSVMTALYYWNEEVVVCRNIVSPQASEDENTKSAFQRLARINLLALMEELTGRNPSPWGILRGVRPTKIPHKMLDRGLSIGAVLARLEQQYALSISKAQLLGEISLRQRPFLLSREQAKKLVSVYVGIPYCPSRCLYCSFPAQVLPSDQLKVEGFLQALMMDIDAAAKIIAKYDLKVQNIYVGGGTPTSLANKDFERVLERITFAFAGPKLEEFTVEAGRPDSIDEMKILAMRTVGVNRVSINPQTMQEKTLKLIGRRHSSQDIIEMLEKIRYSGIPIVNMDIIVGLPGEGVQEMTSTMEQLTDLAPDNLTVHTLAIKKGSLLKETRGEYILPGEDMAVNMLNIASSYARSWGMVPYYLYRQKYMTGNLENVGYCNPGKESIYNIQIIEERQTIIGVGPAAATKAVNPGEWRLTSSYHPKDLATYINKIENCLERRATLLAGLFES